MSVTFNYAYADIYFGVNEIYGTLVMSAYNNFLMAICHIEGKMCFVK